MKKTVILQSFRLVLDEGLAGPGEFSERRGSLNEIRAEKNLNQISSEFSDWCFVPTIPAFNSQLRSVNSALRRTLTLNVGLH